MVSEPVTSPHAPYLGPEHAPVREERTLTNLPVQGELPRELSGMFVRNSGSPQFEPQGRYHWFDGDGMLHGLTLQNGTASYRNRWVRTRAFQKEHEAGSAIWPGLLEPLNPTVRPPIKDTANTDVIFHNGELVASWWLSGQPYGISLPALETRGTCDFGGEFKGTFSAHPKVDPVTGDLVFFGFSILKPPYMYYGVVGPDGVLKHYTPIETPHAHVPHDIAITKNYTILMDMPLGWDEKAIAKGKRIIRFNHERPTRLGVVPRLGGSDDVKWFELDPCYAYHTINAYEDGDEIVLYACRIDNPMPENIPENHPTRLDSIDLYPLLYRWRLNMKTGEGSGEVLDDRPTEFPRANDDRLMTPMRYSYNPRLAPTRDLSFDGFIKYDLDSGKSEDFSYDAGWYSGEVLYVSRPGAQDEDDGWVLSILTRGNDSKLVVLNAQDLASGPVATVDLTCRVPLGFHACWAPLAE